MRKQKTEEVKHFFADLGFCIHKWIYVRTERGEYSVIEVCVCEKCGKRKGFKIW